MKVLIACEYSGLIREEFNKLGHYALSCDLEETEIPGNHYKGNVFDIINDNWDLMIAHPPCTYLSYAANKVWNNYGRNEMRLKAARFFWDLYNTNIPHIALENPVGYMNNIFRKPDQIIHPYYFGDPYLKKTCLWLKNLPLLKYDKNIKPPKPIYTRNGTNVHWTESISCKDRGKVRSKTFPGIAKAIAYQWSNAINFTKQIDIFEYQKYINY